MMSPTKEKILNIIKIINIVILCIVSPLMAFIVLFAVNPLMKGEFSDPIYMQALGYLIALVFGALSFWKRSFLALSLIGWVFFALGSQLEHSEKVREKTATCTEMRQDLNCTEDKMDGSMSCTSGKWAGIWPLVCNKSTNIIIVD